MADADNEELLLNAPVADVAPASKSMTHTECVAFAASYLSKRCKVVLPEFFTHNEELPDVIGFSTGIIRNGRWDSGVHSRLIEVKVSRSDFLADRKKPFRIRPEKGMGDFRYYCCPKGMIRKDEVPGGWGLLYVYPSGQVRQVKESTIHERDISSEVYLLYYYARRANFAGVHRAILAYRGFDS
jgi:hypothetical protein